MLLKRHNLQTAGNLNQNIGKALKDMAKGEVNPIQLYGDTLNIIGSFINGIPAGIQEARIESIAQQMKLVEDKKRAIDLRMDRMGDDFIASDKPPVSNAEVFNTPVSNPEPELKAAPTISTPPVPSEPKPQTQWQAESEDTAIDKLLKSNASLDDKLDAIEKTLDKMLEELIKIEKNLEAIQASLEPQAQATNPAPNPEDMVVETEAKTEVEVVANDYMAEVPVRTEIETDIVAEARTETEAAEEVEVPETTVDPKPDYDIDREMVDLISSYEGDLDQLNHSLKVHKLQINLSEDRQRLSVFEIDNSMAYSVFEAQADSKGWKVSSQINDSTKLDILERFVEAEGAVLASVTTQSEQAKKLEKVNKKEPSLYL